jgi:hypothetical protein
LLRYQDPESPDDAIWPGIESEDEAAAALVLLLRAPPMALDDKPATKNGKKGGSTTEVAEMLQVRREHMITGEYHVPPPFDKYHKSNPTTW